MKSSKIEEYLDGNFPEEMTKACYRSHLKKYFKYLEQDPDTYFDAERDYEKDVKLYWQHLMKNYAPKSIMPKLCAIRDFLGENNIEFGRRFWRRLSRRGKGSAVVCQDKIPTVNELKQIITLAKAKDRAFWLMMATGGIRPAELVEVKISDVDASSNPVKITLPATITKNKKQRITFITGEAYNALNAWLTIRDKHLKENMKRFTGLRKYLQDTYQKEINDNYEGRLFPYSEINVRTRWNRILESLGGKFAEKDSTSGRYLLHMYTLRKFFETRLKLVIPEFAVKKYMGHESELNGSYDRLTDKEWANYYAKGQSNLYILEAPANQEDVENIRSEMERLQNQVKEMMKQTEWYRHQAIVVHEDEGKVAVPVYDDEALKQYEKKSKIVKEIKDKSPEVWTEETMKKKKAEKWKRKVSEQ